MFKQSPSRNQRAKGFKLKHGLQMFLLLAVCFWLIYQLKHSHDKKKAFEESTMKLSEKMEKEHGTIKLGRKDLDPRLEEITSKNAHKGEVIEEEEESKHEEELKSEESEEEGRGAGDDEIDEQDQERAEEEAERGEDFVDEEEKDREEKETEEKGNEEKEAEMEDMGSSANQDHDRNTQEAREENYKGDDASSAVVRETQVLTTEAESGNSGDSNEKKLVENIESNEVQVDDKTNSILENTSDQNNLNVKVVAGESIDGNPSANVTTSNEKGVDGSQINSTVTESDVQSEVSNSSRVENVYTPTSVLQNGTSSDSTQDQTLEVTSNGGDSTLQTAVLNQTENSNNTAGRELSDPDTALSTQVENADVARAEFTDTSNNFETVVPEEQTGKANATAGAVDSSLSSTPNENADAIQGLPIDSTDHSISQEEKEARTDLDTLPHIETEGMNSEDAAAE